MLTLFSIPKPFSGHIEIIQKNAIQSWLKLVPGSNIILFGDDSGVAEAAKEFGVRHIPNIETNEYGTPLISAAFAKARAESGTELLTYLNADIMLLGDFIPAISTTKVKYNESNFLIVGRRYDLDVTQYIDFSVDGWERLLRSQLLARGKLHRFSGIDYFVFPRKLDHGMPPFAVGRPRWDNWLIYNIRSRHIDVVDATEMVTVVHQNHESIYKINGIESLKNLEQSGGYAKMCTILDANKLLTLKGVVTPPLLRAIYSAVSLLLPFRVFLALKRRVQDFFYV